MLCSTLLRVALLCQGLSLSSAAQFDKPLVSVKGKEKLAVDASPKTRLSRVHGSASALKRQTPDPAENEILAATGVAENAVGDLDAFIVAAVTYTVMCIVLVLTVSCLRTRFPIVYAGRVLDKTVPFEPSDSFFGWLSASRELTIDQVVEYDGLDQGMLLEFANFSMRVLFFIGGPLCLILAPIHCFCGNQAAGEDYLSYQGIANVSWYHPWIFGVHAVLVWVVVAAVQTMCYNAQEGFLVRRKAWLQKLPLPRATTVLVSGIPEEQCTDAGIKAFFDKVFDKSVVHSAFMVKHTETLEAAVAACDAQKTNLEKAEFQLKSTGERPSHRNPLNPTQTLDSIEYYTEQVQSADKLVSEERAKVQKAVSDGDKTIYTDIAFVTFKTRRDSESALKATYTSNDFEFVCEIPPDPADVIWADFERDPTRQMAQDAIGYGLIAFTYWCYMPFIIGVAMIASLKNLAGTFPSLQSMAEDEATVAMWNGLMGQLALLFFISFVPTFFVLIFRGFFALKADAWLQYKLYHYYFWFHIVYVLCVPAIGTSVIATFSAIAQSPFLIFELLATTLPTASHFFLNYLPAMWWTHPWNSVRIANLNKYLAFKLIFEEDKAKKLAEPEDQDYFGIGGRTGRWSFMLVLSLTFCTIAPMITILGWINFWISRMIYGYLTTFAETLKPDTGGAFWVAQLKHVQQCQFIFIALMSGILMLRAPTYWPCVVSGASTAYWYWSTSRFDGTFRWESLCLLDGLQLDEAKVKHTEATYEQPCLIAKKK